MAPAARDDQAGEVVDPVVQADQAVPVVDPAVRVELAVVDLLPVDPARAELPISTRSYRPPCSVTTPMATAVSRNRKLALPMNVGAAGCKLPMPTVTAASRGPNCVLRS